MNIKMIMDGKQILDTDYANLLAMALVGIAPEGMEDLSAPQEHWAIHLEGVCNIDITKDETTVNIDADLSTLHQLQESLDTASELLPDEGKVVFTAVKSMIPRSVAGDMVVDYDHGSIRYCDNHVAGELKIPMGLDTFAQV